MIAKPDRWGWEKSVSCLLVKSIRLRICPQPGYPVTLAQDLFSVCLIDLIVRSERVIFYA